MKTRVGFGYDIHPLREGRKLFLGGFEVPSIIGLDGHSDADVVLHSLCDAILGALSLGDIGDYFPDTSEETENIRSTIIVEKIKKLKAFEIINVDITVVAETPILTPHKSNIRESVARILEIEKDKVSIKAKRNEGFGVIGEKKAIACFTVVFLRII